jgi:thiol-disulfide isomerase/thioredoxin
VDQPPAPAPQPKNHTQLLTWLVVAAVIGAWVGLLMARRPVTNDDVAAPSSPPAEFNWKLETLEGKPASLADFKGRPIFLNLWATWCGPCVKELPSIEALAADPRIKATDAVVLAVAVGGEDRNTVAAFWSNRKLPSIQVRSTLAEPPPVFQTQGIPATFFIARDGRIDGAAIGSRDWNTDSTISRLETLAAEPAPKPNPH